jgi:hypothetical protein
MQSGNKVPPFLPISDPPMGFIILERNDAPATILERIETLDEVRASANYEVFRLDKRSSNAESAATNRGIRARQEEADGVWAGIVQTAVGGFDGAVWTGIFVPKPTVVS